MVTRNKVGTETDNAPEAITVGTMKIRPQGSVIDPVAVPGGGFDLSPTAGYDGHYPVQFSDESDATFAGRLAMFLGSLASARQIASGGATLEDAKAAAKARYDAEIANLEVVYRDKALRSTLNGVPVAVPPTPQPKVERKTVESKDGSTREVDKSYVLKDGESEV